MSFSAVPYFLVGVTLVRTCMAIGVVVVVVMVGVRVVKVGVRL